MKSGIYQIRNVENGKIYIGSAAYFAGRFATHRTLLRQSAHRNTKLQRAWNKYGEAAFRFERLLVCSKENLVMYEQACIDRFNVVKKGYNVLPVAGSALGFRHSEEHIARLRGNQHALGYKHKPETLVAIAEASRGNQYGKGWKAPEKWRANLSAKLKGKPKSAEHRAKIGAAHRGMKRSEEAKANMRAAMAVRKAKAEAA